MKTNCDKIQIIKNQFLKKDNMIVLNNLDQNVFKIKRIFIVKENENIIRGKHSHIKCKQLLVCLEGKIKVICDDGFKKKTFILNSPNKSILIPNNIWVTQKYLDEKNILKVCCDMDFSEKDYIRDYKTFLNYIANKK